MNTGRHQPPKKRENQPLHTCKRRLGYYNMVTRWDMKTDMEHDKLTLTYSSPGHL